MSLYILYVSSVKEALQLSKILPFASVQGRGKKKKLWSTLLIMPRGPVSEFREARRGLQSTAGGESEGKKVLHHIQVTSQH